MAIFGGTEIKQQIFMLGQMIEALTERSHLDMSAPEQILSTSFPPVAGSSQESKISTTSAQMRAILRSRRLRDEVFGNDLFADPAWDMLLDLMAARLERTQVSVSSLCIAAAVPPTTALRWLRQLTERGLVQREADPEDGRRIFVALSSRGMEAMIRWLRESRIICANTTDASEAPASRTAHAAANRNSARPSILTG